MDTSILFWLVPVASLVALGFAFIFYRQMLRQDEGQDPLAFMMATGNLRG